MKPPLTLLPLLFICFAVIGAQAQTGSFDVESLNQNPDYLQWFRNKTTVIPNNKDFLINLNKNQRFLQNAKPGVHCLLQDGMPCLVPDTKDIAAIPNAWKGKIIIPFTGNFPRIPNPVQRQKNVPGKK